MSLLLYCICEAEAEVKPPAAGVRGAAVQGIVADGLRCFYSEAGNLGGGAAAVQKDALEFHRVTHDIFQGAAIIPFRFPTLLPNAAEIAALVALHAGEYSEALKRLHDTVQMEIRISAGAAAAEPGSGTEYMRARADITRNLKQAWAECNAAAGPHALEWRQRRSREGVHCFALVRRGEVYNFEQALRGLQPDEGMQIVVSGPWPATEFLNLEGSPTADSSRAEARSE